MEIKVGQIWKHKITNTKLVVTVDHKKCHDPEHKWNAYDIIESKGEVCDGMLGENFDKYELITEEHVDNWIAAVNSDIFKTHDEKIVRCGACGCLINVPENYKKLTQEEFDIAANSTEHTTLTVCNDCNEPV